MTLDQAIEILKERQEINKSLIADDTGDFSEFIRLEMQAVEIVLNEVMK